MKIKKKKVESTSEPEPPSAQSIKLSNGWNNRFPPQRPFTSGDGINNTAFRMNEPPLADDIFHMGAIDDLDGRIDERFGGSKEADFVEA